MPKNILIEDYKKAQIVIAAFKSVETRPTPLDEPNFVILTESTEKYIDLLSRGIISDDDFKEQIFINAMEAVFGYNIWAWVKNNIHTSK